MRGLAILIAAALAAPAGAADLMDDLPPLGPDKDMRVMRTDSPEARSCAASAGTMARSLRGRIIRSVFTYSPAWGMVWRGDITGGGSAGGWRYICSVDLKGKKRFVVVPARETPPLASGPWGDVRTP